MNDKLQSLSDRIAQKAEDDFKKQLKADLQTLRNKYIDYGDTKITAGTYINGNEFKNVSITLNADQVMDAYVKIVESTMLPKVRQTAIDDFMTRVEQLEGMIHE